METLTRGRIVKGSPVRCGSLRIVPVSRLSESASLIGSSMFISWSLTPIGIEVLTDTGTYAIDLDGNLSEQIRGL